MGGAPPGKSGLPGLGRSLQHSQSQQQMFVQYEVPGRKTKLLQPSNVPYRPHAASGGQVGAPGRAARQVTGTVPDRTAAEAGRPPRRASTEQEEAVQGTTRPAEVTASGAGPRTGTSARRGPGSASALDGRRPEAHDAPGTHAPRVPKIMSLRELNHGGQPLAGLEGATGEQALGLHLPLTAREPQPRHAGATQAFANAAISSRDLLQRQSANPQFQLLNMAPYLKESRQYVKEHELLQRTSGGSLDLGGGPVRAPLTSRHQESQSTLESRPLPRQGEEGLVPRPGALSTSHSRPVLSVMTGLVSMTPLGPALGSVRSFSRSRVEQYSARQTAQRELGRKSKLEILSSLEARALQQREPTDGAALESSPQQPRPKQKLLQRLAEESLRKQQQDARLDKIRTKLKTEQGEKRKLFNYMQGVEPANSRHNIVAGRTEARDEAIRRQLLIGKLRASEQPVGDRDSVGGAGLPARSSAGLGGERFQLYREQQESADESHTVLLGSGVQQLRIPEKEESRGVP